MSTYSADGLEVGRGLVLEVVGVGNLLGSPDTLVRRVVDEGSGPLALVGRVLLHRRLPLAATRDFIALGVGNGRRNPVTVLLVIPVLRLLGLGVRNSGGLILKPVFRLGSLLIDNLKWRVLVPVLGLGSLGVSDAGLVNPVFGLCVVGVINLRVGVDGGSEVLQESTVANGLAVDLHLEALVGLDDEGVKAGGLYDTGHGRVLEVLLLILASLGVLVAEDEVDLES